MKIVKLTKETQHLDLNDEFGIEVLTGLSTTPKQISAKYFYDDKGSEIFQKITQEPDYYPTKKEFSILEKLAGELPAIIKPGTVVDIIELGAGDGHKSKLLIDGFLNAGIKVDYYPIDISEKAMRLMEMNLRSTDTLKLTGIVADYFTGLSHVRSVSKNPKLVLFLGSNIGNFDQVQSLEFLRKLWRAMDHGDYLLTGFDQKKDFAVLNRAYNDSAGHTAAFNINLLDRINRELDASFDTANFKHYGFYNPIEGAMESHLISLKQQTVEIRGLKKKFNFTKFEPIHLEYSFKFLPADIEFLCEQTGFATVNHFSDDDGYFVDSLWQVVKT